MKPSSHFARAVKLTTPFRSKGHEATIAVIKTAAALKKGIESRVKPEGISTQQFNVLRILRGAGEPLPTMEVSSRMIEQEPGITKLMRKLEKKGFVERSRSEPDTRVVMCRITESGLGLLKRVDEPVAGFEDGTFERLTEKQVTTLIELLERLEGPG